jgi:hypothetical protein
MLESKASTASTVHPHAPTQAWLAEPSLLQPEQFNFSPAPSSFRKLWMYFKIHLYHQERWFFTWPIGLVTIIITTILVAASPHQALPIIGCAVAGFLLATILLVVGGYLQDIKKTYSLSLLIKADWLKKLTLHERLFFCQKMKMNLGLCAEGFFFETQTTAAAKYQNKPLYYQQLENQIKELIDFFGLVFLLKRFNRNTDPNNADFIFFLFSLADFQSNFDNALKEIYPAPPNSTEERWLIEGLKKHFSISNTLDKDSYKNCSNCQDDLFLFIAMYEQYLISHSVPVNSNLLLAKAEELSQELAIQKAVAAAEKEKKALIQSKKEREAALQKALAGMQAEQIEQARTAREYLSLPEDDADSYSSNSQYRSESGSGQGSSQSVSKLSELTTPQPPSGPSPNPTINTVSQQIFFHSLPAASTAGSTSLLIPGANIRMSTLGTDF